MTEYTYRCYYCGEPGNHRDHTVPSSYSQNTRSFDVSGIVIACPECNQLLGNKIFSSMMERSQYLIDRISKRHKAALNTPDWSERELNKLEANLRAYVEASLRDRDIILRRLEHLSGVKELTRS